MRNLLVVVFVIGLTSCEKQNNKENKTLTAELTVFQNKQTQEEETKVFIIDYIAAVNAPNWKSAVLKYLEGNQDAFIKDHSAFRTSFPNYKATIKHLMVDGNEGIVWLNVSANFAAPYNLDESSSYGDDILKGVEANNQPVSWDETWHFNTVDGKFGDIWDHLKDNYAVLKDLGKIE